MKLVVAGSREYKNLPQVRRYIMELPKDTIIVSGGARGVDREAEVSAYLAGLKVIVIRADWQRFGKDAGYRRNIEMVQLGDKVTVFWDGKSRGAAHTLGLARAADKLLALFISRRAPLPRST